MRYSLTVSAVITVVCLWPNCSIADGPDSNDLSVDRNAQTINVLNSEFQDFDVTDVSLYEVLDWLHDLHPKVKFEIDDVTLKKAGIDPKKTFVHLENLYYIRLKTLIELILGNCNSDLAYTVDNGVVVISTKKKLRSNQKGESHPANQLTSPN
jgi:hypothetical protein